MADYLLIAVVGHRDSGKSSTWYELFNRRVKTSNKERELYLSADEIVKVFLVNGSPQERKVNIADIIPEPQPRIVLCSIQYLEEAKKTFDYFFEREYEVVVKWLNPGWMDKEEYDDTYGLIDYLNANGTPVKKIDGKSTSRPHVIEIREHIRDWATHRNLIYTK